MINKDNHDKANEKKWDIRARTFDKKKHDYFRLMQKMVISMLDLRENSNFLDLGCGTGWAVCYVCSLLKGRGNFIGIDISKEMVEKAGINAQGLDNIAFYKASSEDLPLKNNYFDYIICTNSFHHYLNPLKALAEVHRVLKPGGKIYILDLTSDNFLIKWIDSHTRKIEKEHVRFYSTAEYKDMFSKSGLNHIKSKTAFFPLKVHTAEKSYTAA